MYVPLSANCALDWAVTCLVLGGMGFKAVLGTLAPCPSAPGAKEDGSVGVNQLSVCLSVCLSGCLILLPSV